MRAGSIRPATSTGDPTRAQASANPGAAAVDRVLSATTTTSSGSTRPVCRKVSAVSAAVDVNSRSEK